MTPSRAALVTGPLALLLLTILPPAPAAAADAPADLARRLLRVPADHRLQIRQDDGAVAEGYLVAVDADSVRLAGTPGGPATMAVSLDAIVGARQEALAAEHAFTAGAALGAVVGAVAGYGLVSLIDWGGDSNDTVTDADYATGAIVAATGGALIAGGLGALVSAGASVWVGLPPADGVPARHLEIQGGWATADDPQGVAYDGLHVRAWLPKRASSAFAWGPEAGWSGLGGDLRNFDGTLHVNDTFWAGGAARLALPGGGLRPFLKAGLGWYVREEAWLGISLGGGLLWRTPNGGGAVAEVRWHGRSTGIDDTADNGQLTATAGWAFPF